MKKIIAVAAATVISLSACGTGAASDRPSPTPSSAATLSHEEEVEFFEIIFPSYWRETTDRYGQEYVCDHMDEVAKDIVRDFNGRNGTSLIYLDASSLIIDKCYED